MSPTDQVEVRGLQRSWLISDNDKLLAESDFVAVTVPGALVDI